MHVMKTFLILLAAIVFLIGLGGCSVGHSDFIGFRNDEVGTIMPYKEPFKWDNTGKLRRGDFAISGQGLTHIIKDDNGDLIYHFSGQEILPHYQKKEWVGKCLYYKVVDHKTHIIKAWGFDEGGNPLSCRTWP